MPNSKWMDERNEVNEQQTTLWMTCNLRCMHTWHSQLARVALAYGRSPWLKQHGLLLLHRSKPKHRKAVETTKAQNHLFKQTMIIDVLGERRKSHFNSIWFIQPGWMHALLHYLCFFDRQNYREVFRDLISDITICSESAAIRKSAHRT